MSILSSLSLIGKPKHKKKRLGRGYGSGKGGHTVGRGQKGQRSRGKGKVKLGFEGGQTPIHERLPKYRGIAKRNIGVKVAPKAVNVEALEKHFKSGDNVTKASLIQKGLIAKSDTAKILGHGEISKKLKVINLSVSTSAKAKIEAAGGEVTNEG